MLLGFLSCYVLLLVLVSVTCAKHHVTIEQIIQLCGGLNEICPPSAQVFST